MVERSGTDEYALAEDERIAALRQKGMKAAGQDIPRRPSSQELAKELIDTAKSLARVRYDGDQQGAVHYAVGIIEAHIAIAGEENNWVRGWMQDVTKRMRQSINEHKERKTA